MICDCWTKKAQSVNLRWQCRVRCECYSLGCVQLLLLEDSLLSLPVGLLLLKHSPLLLQLFVLRLQVPLHLFVASLQLKVETFDRDGKGKWATVASKAPGWKESITAVTGGSSKRSKWAAEHWALSTSVVNIPVITIYNGQLITIKNANWSCYKYKYKPTRKF